MSRLDEWLANGLLITDGAWGTELQARGLPPGTIPDTWNLTHPEKVEEVARAYAEAGSQIILTNTFRANGVAMHGVLDAALDAINRAGVAISRRAAGQALVFASIGPTGKMLMSGEMSREQATVEAARRTGLPIIVSFAFDSGKNKDRTMMGATPEAVATAMTEAGADAVGANCGVGVELAVPICERLHKACDLPIWIKPNAGLPALEGSTVCYATSAEFFASHFAALRKAGAAFLGSCCGSTPEFIRALVSARRAAL